MDFIDKKAISHKEKTYILKIAYTHKVRYYVNIFMVPNWLYNVGWVVSMNSLGFSFDSSLWLI